jgi:hypothetical protein
MMGKVPKFVYVLFILCGLCIILFFYLDTKRQLRIAFFIPEELDFRYTRSKEYLLSTISEYFEQRGAKIAFFTVYYTQDTATAPLIEKLYRDSQPTVLFCFDTIQKVSEAPFFKEYDLVFPIYPMTQRDLSTYQNTYPLFGMQEVFFASVQRYFEKYQITYLMIIKDDTSEALSKELSAYLRKNSEIIPSESIGDPGVLNDTAESFFVPGMDWGILLLCSQERVVSLLEKWPGIPRQKILIGPWSLPTNVSYIDPGLLEGTYAISMFSDSETDSSEGSAKSVFPYVKRIADSSLKVLSDLFGKESGIRTELYEIGNNKLSELLAEYRSRPKQQEWLLMEFTNGRYAATEYFNVEKSRWEKYR